MRGAVSLAAALASLSRPTQARRSRGRDLIQYLAFCVIVATLVGQGLTMPLVIRLLGLETDRIEETEENRARIRAAEAALARLEELVEEDWSRQTRTNACAASMRSDTVDSLLDTSTGDSGPRRATGRVPAPPP